MHPLMVLAAFTLAALVTYVLVLGLLTALAIPTDEPEPDVPEEEGEGPEAQDGRPDRSAAPVAC